MHTLAIDTSSAVAAAVVRADGFHAAAGQYAPRGHVERLAEVIQEALAGADLTGGDIGRVVVGTGPAPFTGLRVGIVTARSLARAWEVPLLGVCSLDALGAQATADGGEATAVADARRREVHWATYRDGARVDGPHVSAPADVAAVGTVVGRGAALYAPQWGPEPPLLDPQPGWLVTVADRAAAAGQSEFPTEPLYLRRPDVHGVPGA